MTAVPVFYATTEGQTRRIAEFIAGVLGDHGITSRAIHIWSAEMPVDWISADAALVGASLHLGRHQRVARQFVRRHLAHLNAVPSGFFSVSLAAGSQDPRGAEEARVIARRFVETAGWNTPRVACFAGRLAYTRYDVLTRLVMRWIARREGASTDTAHDHEFTDWQAVRRFALDFAEDIGRTRAPRAA